jgi:proline iminopeptidase
MIKDKMTKKSSVIDAKELSTKTQIKEGFVSVRNGKLFYRMPGKGVPLVVVHGGPSLNQDYLLPQLYKLAENNLVIFYDQRGSGRSLETKLDEKYINIDQFVEDLETLRISLGFDKFILMGHSWGGLLAMKYAVEHQENLI